MKIIQIKTLQTPSVPIDPFNRRLGEHHNLIRNGLKVLEQVIEAIDDYLSPYEDDQPGIMSGTCATEKIIDDFNRIECQLLSLEEALIRRALHD